MRNHLFIIYKMLITARQALQHYEDHRYIFTAQSSDLQESKMTFSFNQEDFFQQ